MALTQKQTQELHTAIEQRRPALITELREDVERVRNDNFEELAEFVFYVREYRIRALTPNSGP